MAIKHNWDDAIMAAQSRYEKARDELRDAAAWLRRIKNERQREEKRTLRAERRARNEKARAERATQLRLFRRAHGLCVKCGLAALPSKPRKNSNGWLKFCASHRESQLEAQRKRTGAKPRQPSTQP